MHAADGQLVIVDTPGMHRPRTLLGERLNSVVQDTLGDVDVIGFCVPPTRRSARATASSTSSSTLPSRQEGRDRHQGRRGLEDEVAEQLLAVSALRDWEAIVPVSAVGSIQLDTVVPRIDRLLPVSPQLYRRRA